jgi:hypothetical protein
MKKLKMKKKEVKKAPKDVGGKYPKMKIKKMK